MQKPKKSCTFARFYAFIMNHKLSQHIFFLGIGGIGMSALARYFHHHGYSVSGYDRTPSPITRALEQEGISVVFAYDKPDISLTLGASRPTVVFTPAIHPNDPIFMICKELGLDMYKRSEVLGLVTEELKALCVAGTHGKTTTSTILAHIMHGSHLGANAFLGGISNNYNSNYIEDKESEFVVIEADEYDHSFLQLSPSMSVITSIDPDHLDIYGNADGYQAGFDDYAALVKDAIVLKKGYSLNGELKANRFYTYAVEDVADFYASNVRLVGGQIYYDLHLQGELLEQIKVGVPARVNVENSVAAAALAKLAGAGNDEIRNGIETYKGVYRRFNVLLEPTVANPELPLVIDDYAHHPTELRESISSFRFIHPAGPLTVVFQPHLFSRTRDLMDGFASVLSQVDDLILLPIYPAREEPIEGVTSDALVARCLQKNPACHARAVEKDDLIDTLQGHQKILILGAGDIDRLVQPIINALSK